MYVKIPTPSFNYSMQCMEQIVSFLHLSSSAVTHRRLKTLPVSKPARVVAGSPSSQ